MLVSQLAPHLRRAVEEISEAVAGPAAADVDRLARFPTEAIEALRAQRLLAAAVPPECGGLGLGPRELVDVAQLLAQGCASTAMIWAMHQIQIACIARHGLPAPSFEAYLREVAERQLLIASVTSEMDVGGDIRTSIAAVERLDDGCRLVKHGSTVSYGASADSFLVTARRCPDSTSGDQVLVLLRREDTVLEQTGEWDTLGMRGTCSPACRLSSHFSPDQILPVPFADVCAQTMVPFSHLLWSACWLGIATDAVRRARARLRSRPRSSPLPAGDERLADVAGLLLQMRATVEHCAATVETLLEGSPAAAFSSLGLAIEMNQLKCTVSELVTKIVGQALSICGMAGYQSHGPYSVARHLRDAYSAGLMIGNERLRAANAVMLLAQKAI